MNLAPLETASICMKKIFSEPLPILNDANQSHIFDQLAEDGLAFFKFDDQNDVANRVKTLGEVLRHPDSPDQDFTPIISTGVADYLPGQRGFSTRDLVPHTDQATRERPPELLSFLCLDRAKVGGASVMIDGKAVFDHLAYQHPQFLSQLMDPSSVYHRYEDSFSPIPIFDRLNERDVLLRARFDELSYANSQLWDAMITLKHIMSDLTLRYELQSGEGYILQNTRWLHGRESFSGRRSCLRLLMHASNEHLPTFGSFKPSSLNNFDLMRAAK